MKPSPISTPSESACVIGSIKRARSEKILDEETKSSSANPNSNLLVIPLGEVLEIIRLYACSAPTPSCADWSSIAVQACKGRISASDAEYIANEFIPTVHYRPSVGMVVMERTMRNHVSEYHRHKLTVRRLKQGLPLIVERFKTIFLGQEPMKGDVAPQVSAPKGTCEVVQTEEMFKEEIQEENEQDVSGVGRSGRPRTSVTVSNFESLAPGEYFKELRSRAQTTISRYENGEVPLYALKPVNESDAVAAGLTATGRVKRRYETKAIRLAKAAAAVASGDVETPSHSMLVESPPSEIPKVSRSFQLHSIFQKTAEQFARNRALSSTSSSPDQIV